MEIVDDLAGEDEVTSREGRVSRNCSVQHIQIVTLVTSREGRVSRNLSMECGSAIGLVTSREGRVSRNLQNRTPFKIRSGHVPRGACE